MPNIKGPNGKVISFPDGTPDSEISAAFESMGPTVAGAGSLGLPQPAAHPAVDMRDAGLYDQTRTMPGEPLTSRLLKNTVRTVGTPFVHPGDAIKALIPQDFATQYQDAIKEPKPTLAEGLTDATGQGIGIAALGAAGGAGLKLAGKVAAPTIGRIGAAMQDTAADIRNSKFTPTMKETIRDNNPGRGTLQAGIGTTLNKGSYANKISGATEAVGGQIGDAVTRADQNALAPPILSSEIAPAITGPIESAVAKLNGPFGTAPTSPYETMRGKLGNTAPGATAPIYGPNAPTEILPSDLWKHIRNLDENTRFNTDPEVESVNETRRDIRQGLRPSLEAADPTIKPSSRLYSDLLSASDAVSRTQGGFGVPKGISSLVDSTIKSTPVITGGSSALFKLGGGLKNFATNARGGAPASIGFQPKATPPAPALLGSGEIATPGGADYTGGGFPGRPIVITPQPQSLFRLPATAGEGEVQPMLGIPNDYPELASPFARERVPPNVFNRPESPVNPLFRVGPDGPAIPERLGLPAPKIKPKKR